MNAKRYALITSARNEEKYIKDTIESVISQTIHPSRWIIASDNSSDRTDEIVKIFSETYRFIHLLVLGGYRKRDFASKAYCLNKALETLGAKQYSFIGILDADIVLPSDYYEKIFDEFELNGELGIAGGLVEEMRRGKRVAQRISLDSVAGAVQVYRRSCFEDCGSFMPLHLGGEDALMEKKAKMNGWKVKTFQEIRVFHAGNHDCRNNRIVSSNVRQGMMFYELGYHPLFFFLRSIYKLFENPFLYGSLFQLAGFSILALRKKRIPIPPLLRDYIRREQMERLKNMFFITKLMRKMKRK